MLKAVYEINILQRQAAQLLLTLWWKHGTKRNSAVVCTFGSLSRSWIYTFAFLNANKRCCNLVAISLVAITKLNTINSTSQVALFTKAVLYARLTEHPVIDRRGGSWSASGYAKVGSCNERRLSMFTFSFHFLQWRNSGGLLMKKIRCVPVARSWVSVEEMTQLSAWTLLG